ncbi:MAG: hypothetical protein AB8G99_11465 [Planctomycetaceae bacterium]
MSEPYRIRLRGPWQFVDSEGTEGTQKLPTQWLGPKTSVRLTRKFNWIAELEPSERVFVVFAGYGGVGSVTVNEQKLGSLPGGPAEFDISPLLQSGNLLEVALDFEALPEDTTCGLWGDVLLEVRTVADQSGQKNAEAT